MFQVNTLNITSVEYENKIPSLVVEKVYLDIIDLNVYSSIIRLDFDPLQFDDDSETLYEFIERNFMYLHNLQSLSISQPLGRCDLIDIFHIDLISLFNVDVDIKRYGDIIVYNLLPVQRDSEKLMFGQYMTMKTITNIY